MAASTTNTATQTPIVFTARGLEIDTRLRVFDTDFHVHSTILKIGSAFFYKFLDSPEKKGKSQTPLPGRFKYEWVTEVDEDGKGWSLVVTKDLKKRTHDMNVSRFAKQKDSEINTFHNLMSAIYHEPYEIKNHEQLMQITQLADYYCALPAVSTTLSAASTMCSIPRIWKMHSEKLREVLQVACKLRCRHLFEYVIIVIAGRWSSPLDKADKLGCFSEVVNNVRGRIEQLVGQVHTELFKEFAGKEEYSKFSKKAVENLTSKAIKDLPEYYRLLFEQDSAFINIRDGKCMRNIISPLLEDNRKLGNVNIKHGQIWYKEYFLCGKVKDEEIPWDMTEKDW